MASANLLNTSNESEGPSASLEASKSRAVPELLESDNNSSCYKRAYYKALYTRCVSLFVIFLISLLTQAVLI